jgi:hypothetical protein
VTLTRSAVSVNGSETKHSVTDVGASAYVNTNEIEQCLFILCCLIQHILGQAKSTRARAVPKLLQLCWNGHPLLHLPFCGWCYWRIDGIALTQIIHVYSFTLVDAFKRMMEQCATSNSTPTFRIANKYNLPSFYDKFTVPLVYVLPNVYVVNNYFIVTLRKSFKRILIREELLLIQHRNWRTC